MWNTSDDLRGGSPPKPYLSPFLARPADPASRPPCHPTTPPPPAPPRPSPWGRFSFRQPPGSGEPMTIHVKGIRRMRTIHLPQHDGLRNPAPLAAAISASTLPTEDPMPYVAFDQRTPDAQSRGLLRRILEEGEDVPSSHGVPARRIIGYLIRFRLANGFPIITQRA